MSTLLVRGQASFVVQLPEKEIEAIQDLPKLAELKAQGTDLKVFTFWTDPIFPSRVGRINLMVDLK